MSRVPGFSLIELVTVLVIVGALTAIALPRYADAHQRYRASMTAHQVATDLDRVRASARAVGVEQTVRFDLSAQQYTRPELPEPYEPSEVKQVSVGLGPSHDSARLLLVDFNGQATLTYTGHGRAKTAGSLLVGNGQIAKRVRVEAQTGQAIVEDGFEPSPEAGQ